MQSPAQEHWPSNYFNYFTEIEEHFRKARGTGMFLLSPLDWALIESWKDGGIPLEAVLRGIDIAFEKWRSKPGKFRQVNSLAYCTQAVMAEATLMAGGPRNSAGAGSPAELDAPFTLEELRSWLERGAVKVGERPGFEEVAAALRQLADSAEQQYAALEDLERHLTALEDKLVALARSRWTEDELIEARKSLDVELKPYRGKMSAPQLAMLEKQYLDRRVLEAANLPRLSLFYMG